MLFGKIDIFYANAGYPYYEVFDYVDWDRTKRMFETNVYSPIYSYQKYVKHLDSYKSPRITYLDEVEDECWNLFKSYAPLVGVSFGDGIDYTIAKEISEKIMSLVERTFGVDFPMSKGG